MNVQIRRLLTISTIGVAAVLAVIYGFLPKPVLVDAAKASRGSFRVTIEEEGKTRLTDRFLISAPVAGFMRRIELKVGDSVKKDQQVFILEPLRSNVLDPRSRAEAESGVSTAQAALKAAEERERASKADLDYVEQRLDRLKRLLSKGYITRDAFDQAETETKRAQAVHLSAKATTNMARSDLERAHSILKYSAASNQGSYQETVTVRSPGTGKVMRLYRESEGVVNVGEPVMEIGDPANLEVRVELLSSDAVKINKGAPVFFERWGGEIKLTGKVRTIEPVGFTKISSLGVEEQRVLAIVDITSQPGTWQQLGDGYRLEASFVVWEGQNILQIPASALFRVGDKWAVFILEKNKARQQEVEVGHRNGLQAEILSGLSEGTMVITQPDDSIKDGSRVRIR